MSPGRFRIVGIFVRDVGEKRDEASGSSVSATNFVIRPLSAPLKSHLATTIGRYETISYCIHFMCTQLGVFP